MLSNLSDNRTDLERRIAALSSLEGGFLLRSGQASYTYFDKFRFEGDPYILRQLARSIEGQDISGRNVTFIEDVITTGGAVTDSYKLAREESAMMDTVVCAIWRGEGEPHIAKARDLPVIPAFTRDDLENT